MAHQHNYNDVAKLAVPGTFKCLIPRESALVIIEKLLTWISDRQAKVVNVNFKIRQKAKTIFDKLKTEEENCQNKISTSKGLLYK